MARPEPAPRTAATPSSPGTTPPRAAISTKGGIWNRGLVGVAGWLGCRWHRPRPTMILWTRRHAVGPVAPGSVRDGGKHAGVRRIDPGHRARSPMTASGCSADRHGEHYARPGQEGATSGGAIVVSGPCSRRAISVQTGRGLAACGGHSRITRITLTMRSGMADWRSPGPHPHHAMARVRDDQMRSAPTGHGGP